jgi:hypothetical protein
MSVTTHLGRIDFKEGLQVLCSTMNFFGHDEGREGAPSKRTDAPLPESADAGWLKGRPSACRVSSRINLNLLRDT